MTPPAPKPPPDGETALRWSLVAAVVAAVLIMVLGVIPCTLYLAWFLVGGVTSTTH